jgi:protein-tyrosine phosphatase
LLKEEYFESAIEFIRLSERCLVHCAAGVSRSPTIVLAYLIVEEKMTLREAFDLVAARRFVLPNEGFMGRLMELEVKERGGAPSVSMSDFNWDSDDDF